jgi:hypothetical protein
MIEIGINDFPLFVDTISAISGFSEEAKLNFDGEGMTCFAKNKARTIRLSSFTNSVKTVNGEKTSICFDELSTLTKLLMTVLSSFGTSSASASRRRSQAPSKQVSADYSTVKFGIDFPNIVLSSRNIKVKLTTVDETVISGSVLNSAPDFKLNKMAEFRTTPDDIKGLTSNSFIFKNQLAAHIELVKQNDMVRNAVYARIFDSSSPSGNVITCKFGEMTDGSLPSGIFIDFDRVQFLNFAKSDAIDVSVMSSGSGEAAKADCLFCSYKTSGSDAAKFSKYELLMSVIKG